MRTVAITTTINVPHVLRLLRAAGQHVKFIVVGDRKSPHAEIHKLCAEIGNAVYYSDTDQEKLGYACSELIGWNCIMRRSIALLEALKLKPDVIVTIDDDNLPLDPSQYFSTFGAKLGLPYTGLSVEGNDNWFNVGDLADPPVVHRGFPLEPHLWEFKVGTAIDAKVGVVAGLWYGDPDIGAVERITNAPNVARWAAIAEQGFVVEPWTWAPFNSQNTAYCAELAPLIPMLPAIGRADDIWASYIAERIMWEHGYRVFYGPPFVYQERNEQSLLRNLRDEMFGMQHTLKFVDWLYSLPLKGSPVEMQAQLWGLAQGLHWLPVRLREFGLAWCRDAAKVLEC